MFFVAEQGGVKKILTYKVRLSRMSKQQKQKKIARDIENVYVYGYLKRHLATRDA